MPTDGGPLFDDGPVLSQRQAERTTTTRPAVPSTIRHGSCHEEKLMSADARTAVETYFRAWQDGDFESLRTVLADDVSFRGPLGQADGAEQCVAGLRGMSQLMTGLEVRARVVEGSDVITFFDLLTGIAPPASTANWSHVEGGRITSIRVAFDPRAILAGSS